MIGTFQTRLSSFSCYSLGVKKGSHLSLAKHLLAPLPPMCCPICKECGWLTFPLPPLSPIFGAGANRNKKNAKNVLFLASERCILLCMAVFFVPPSFFSRLHVTLKESTPPMHCPPPPTVKGWLFGPASIHACACSNSNDLQTFFGLPSQKRGQKERTDGKEKK